MKFCKNAISLKQALKVEIKIRIIKDIEPYIKSLGHWTNTPCNPGKFRKQLKHTPVEKPVKRYIGLSVV